MMAIVVDAEIEWNGGIVAASVVISLVAATAAYWILFRLLALYPRKEILRFISALIAAVAVNGMHYTGMGAARYIYMEGKADRLPKDIILVNRTVCVFGAIVASISFLFVSVLMITADLRAWYYDNDHILRHTVKIMSTLEEAGERNVIAWKAVQTFKLLRPDYQKESSDHLSGSNRSLLPSLRHDNHSLLTLHKNSAVTPYYDTLRHVSQQTSRHIPRLSMGRAPLVLKQIPQLQGLEVQS
jgi:hypothetical protein